MQKIRKWYEENRGRKLAVLIFGAFGYALLAALGSQIEQFGATTWSRSLVRLAAAFPIAFAALALLLGGLMPRMASVGAGGGKTTVSHRSRVCVDPRELPADVLDRVPRFVCL